MNIISVLTTICAPSTVTHVGDTSHFSYSFHSHHSHLATTTTPTQQTMTTTGNRQQL
jgi:hypothetical protein